MDEINFKYPMIDPVLVKIIKKIYNHKKKETIKSLVNVCMDYNNNERLAEYIAKSMWKTHLRKYAHEWINKQLTSPESFSLNAFEIGFKAAIDDINKHFDEQNDTILSDDENTNHSN